MLLPDYIDGWIVASRRCDKHKNDWGGSPGQVVMGDNSCSKGCGFKSLHCILYWMDIISD